MIYITGDTHADFSRFSTNNFPEQKGMTKDDYVIICGDFGGIWTTPGSDKTEKYWLDWLESKPFTILFVDGNHECLHKDTEILTTEGWVNIKDIYENKKDYLVASVDMQNHKLSYSVPLNKIKKFAPKLLDFRGTNFRQCVTPNHEIIVNEKKIRAIDASSMDIREYDFRYNIQNKFCGIKNCSNEIIEILTMIIMDGTIVDESKYNPNSKKMRIQFHFKKIRKIIYLQNLLDTNNIKYTIRKSNDGTTYITIYSDDARYLYGLLNKSKQIPAYWRDLSDIQFRYFLNALVNSDGTPAGTSYIRWNTTSKNNLDIVSELCIKHNYDINISVRENNSGYTDNCLTQYIVSIGKDKDINHKVKIEEIDYNDYAYCLTMKNGTLITRYNLIPCVTGNCFDRYYSNEFPTLNFHGGKAHQIRSNIYHLMRGYVFEFEGKKFFTFGGASSHDIKDGILKLEDYSSMKELVRDYNRRTRNGEMLRINHISWWEKELPTDNEMKRGIRELERVNYNVDYVITHCLPHNVESILFPDSGDKLTRYFDSILANGLQFKEWHCGHYHIEDVLLEKYVIHYCKIERLV